MKANWTYKRFDEIADFNPRETLPKGQFAKKIGMEKLIPFRRDVAGYELEPYSGGSKFRNNDTLMARITPCLENGKISKINVLEEDEVGFGSTEYIVLRAIPGIADPDYIYYLACSPAVREPAIKSMVGSSGRQRVQTPVVQALEIPVPPLEEQKKIVSVLKDIDDKIINNIRLTTHINELAKAIFKEWFIDSPDKIMWPEGNLSDLVVSTLGGDWGKETENGNYTEQVYCIRGADIPDVNEGNKGKMPTRYILPKNYKSKQLVDGDLVVEISGGSPTQSTGRIAAISQALLDRYDKGMVCTNFCRAIKPIPGYSFFIYYYWMYLYDRNVFFSYENGTTGIKNLDLKGVLDNEEIHIPPIELVSRFNEYCQTISDQIFSNGIENERMCVLRDYLTPQLLTGDIDAASVTI